MSKVTRNNRKSRSSVRGRLFAIVDKSNRLYQANPIPARNLSLPLLFLITNVIVYIYIYKRWFFRHRGLSFPRSKQQSNRTFRSAPPIPEEGNISCARSTVFPRRPTTPRFGGIERGKGIYTNDLYGQDRVSPRPQEILPSSPRPRNTEEPLSGKVVCFR